MAGGKRAVLCWHRRYGKDELALHYSAIAMVRRPATYWYLLPLKDQARTAIWEAINPHTGKRRIDEAFPDELFVKRETDMLIKCKANASTWQIKGSDNYQAAIGSPPAGIVFSEYALSNPDAWAFLRPILRENNGWVIFNSTPRGHNHFEHLLRYALSPEGVEDGWFGQVLTVDDTGSMTPEQLQRELREIAAERQSLEEAQALVQQEYYCSFDSATPGAIYGPIIAQMEKDGRIGDVPHHPGFAVQASTDIGASEGNDMGVVWSQKIGNWTNIIDCEGAPNVGIDKLAEWLNDRAMQRKFLYAPIAVNLPHDAGHPQPSNEGAASFAQKLFKAYQYQNRVNVVTKSLAWSITRVKHSLAAIRIDRKACARLIEAMRCYHRKWDPVKKCYSENPVHDWTSNLNDALRTLVEAKDAEGVIVVDEHNAGVQLPYAPIPRERVRMAIGADDDVLGRR